jgi:glycerol kinase
MMKTTAGQTAADEGGNPTMASYIGAIDQGTTSSRFIVFDRSGRIVSTAQREHEQIYPQPGWVEHDPEEIWRRTDGVIQEAMEARGLRPEDLAAIGITNQRETTVVSHAPKPTPAICCLATSILF